MQFKRLKMLKASHLSQRYALEDKIAKAFPDQIAALEQKISGYKSDIELREAQTMPNEDGFSSMEVEGTAYIEKKAAGSALLAAAHNMTSPDADSNRNVSGLCPWSSRLTPLQRSID